MSEQVKPSTTSPSATWLVLPDVHTFYDSAEAIIARVAPQKVVFLGDYFDQFDDSPKTAQHTAEWLKHSLSQPNRLHLFGNHDLHYAFPDVHTICTGYTLAKDLAINKVMRPADWRKLQLYCLESNFLMTHAGLHPYFVPAGQTVEKFLQRAVREALHALVAGRPHWSFTAGESRWGPQIHGGITWCDLTEFQPIPGLNQLFGHTPLDEPAVIQTPDSYNVCLDTTLPENRAVRHYALLQDGHVKICEAP